MYRLNETTPDGALSDFSDGVHDLALRHAAPVAILLPEGEADIQRLRDRAAALLAASVAWANDSREQGEARRRRDDAHASVRADYSARRGRLKHLVRRISGGSTAAPLLKLCPAPSQLKSADALLAALQALSDGLPAHGALLALIGVDVAAAQAEIAAQREALAQVVAALDAADCDRARSSRLRAQAHAGALAQVRLVVSALEVDGVLPAEDQAVLDRLRILHLPRYVASRAPEPTI